MKTKFFIMFLLPIFLGACTEKQAKLYECTAYSAECELQKDNILFLPIEFDTTVVDAYGMTFDKFGYKWYFSNKKSCTSVPIFVTGSMTKFPTPAALLERWNLNGHKFDIDTVDISNRVPGISRAAIVLCGADEIIPAMGTDGVYAIVAFAR